MTYLTIAEYSKISKLYQRACQYSPEVLNELLAEASALCDGYIGSAVALPLDPSLAARKDLHRVVSFVADYDILSKTGFNPENAADAIVVRNYEFAIKWLERVAKGEISFVYPTPNGAASNSLEYATVTSEEPRGW